MTSTKGYSVRPVGIVRSRLTNRQEAPKQGSEGAPEAWVEIDPPFARALDDSPWAGGVLTDLAPQGPPRCLAGSPTRRSECPADGGLRRTRTGPTRFPSGCTESRCWRSPSPCACVLSRWKRWTYTRDRHQAGLERRTRCWRNEPKGLPGSVKIASGKGD